MTERSEALALTLDEGLRLVVRGDYPRANAVSLFIEELGVLGYEVEAGVMLTEEQAMRVFSFLKEWFAPVATPEPEPAPEPAAEEGGAQ